MLSQFAEKVGAKYYRDWEAAGIATAKGGNLMDPGFIREAMTKAAKIHFNLEGFSRAAYQEFLKKPEFSRGNVTNWELNQILNRPDFLSKTTFYGEAGGIVPAPSF